MFKKKVKRKPQIYNIKPPYIPKVIQDKMTIYICSPYRAVTEEEKERNIDYARELTRRVIQANHTPITPHLYLTQCLNDNIPEERQQGLAAGIELLLKCDCIVVGTKYGISEGMLNELVTAEENGIKVMLAEWLEESK